MAPIPSPALLRVAALGLLLSAPALAQDAHYTTRQFGNRAWLLGGSFVGNPGDISAVYYNPGALGILGTPELELTGSVYEFARLKVEDGMGRGRALSDSNVSVLPSLIAGSLRFAFLGRSKLAYSLLTRQGVSFSLESRDSSTGTDLAGVGGMDALSTDVRLDQSVSEYWAGLSWAVPIGGHLGLGLSPFLAYRQQELRFQTLAEGSGDAGQQLLATLGRDVRLQHVRVLLKVGASYQDGPWAVGLAVTTPSLGLWGQGSAGYQRAILTQGFDVATPAPVFDFQEGLAARFRSPWGAALGASRRFSSTTVYLSLEGYARVTPLTLVDSEPIVPRGSTESIDGDFDLALKPVLNAALGVEQRLGERVRVYLSGHTDFSALARTPATNALLGAWDLYHVASGVHWGHGRTRFTLGSDVAWGGKQSQRLADALRESGIASSVDSLDVRSFQVTLLIGASFSFAPSQGEGGGPDTGNDTGAEAP